MTTLTAGSDELTTSVNKDAFVDSERPLSWSRQMVALIKAGHYREGYEILADKMPFVENQLRPYAEKLAGQENYWTDTFAWICRLIDTATPQRILDVGCGVGPIAIELARMGHQGWGIDILSSMIKRGQELIDELELSERAHLIEGDIRRPERYFEESYFDSAVACDVFEHLDDPSLIEVLEGLCRVVRPGGQVVVQTSPGLYYYWFEPDRWKLLSLLVPFAWLPDRLFTAYTRALDRFWMRGIRREPASFYRHEYGHINCMTDVHLARLMKRAGLKHVRTFAVHAHPRFKTEGCLRAAWTRTLFGHKSVACRNVFGVATVPGRE